MRALRIMTWNVRLFSSEAAWIQRGELYGAGRRERDRWYDFIAGGGRAAWYDRIQRSLER